MSTLSDDIINGTLCEECTIYIGPGLGYSRKCAECQFDNQVRARQSPLDEIATRQRMRKGVRKLKKEQ